jgi:hypothetical protein
MFFLISTIAKCCEIFGNRDGKIKEFLFKKLIEIVVDKRNSLYVADCENSAIKIISNRKIKCYDTIPPKYLSLDKNETIFFSNNRYLFKLDPQTFAFKKIKGVSKLNWPFAIDNNGDIYFCSWTAILKWTDGVVNLFAGHITERKMANGSLLEVRFRGISFLYCCSNGNILVGEYGMCIRKISKEMVTTVVNKYLRYYSMVEIVENSKGNIFLVLGS